MTDHKGETTKGGQSREKFDKFAFDNDFFDVAVVGKSAALGSAPKPPSLEDQKREAFENGLNEGRRQGEAALESKLAELQTTLQHVTEALAKAQTSYAANAQHSMLGLMRLMLHKIVGHAASHYPDDVLEHHLKHMLEHVQSESILTLKIHPQTAALHEKLGTPRLSLYGHHIRVEHDSRLAVGDCQVLWDAGGVDAKLEETLANVDGLLLKAGAKPYPLPPKTGAPATAAPAQAAAPAPAAAPQQEAQNNAQQHTPPATPAPPPAAAAAPLPSPEDLLGDDDLIDELKG